jgi:hypothetical protein
MTQMHSLREQPEILKNYAHFHAANDERKGYGITEIIGVLILAFCVFYTVLSLAIGG